MEHLFDKLYLPTFLSAESQDELFSELKSFPHNVDERFYSSYQVDDSLVLQGDGLENLPIIGLRRPADRNELPTPTVRNESAIVLSNTCDISPENPRAFLPPQIIYCPIIQLQKYKNALLNHGRDEIKIQGHIESLRKQRITSMLYLPEKGTFPESIALLDRINNCPPGMIDFENLLTTRIFSLSNYGYYIFLLKISIHLTRIRDGVDRG